MKNPKQTLTFALLFLSKNYSVIPVGDNKRPLVAWKEFQKRRATAEEITSWWGKYPDAQIGIVTGRISNLTVVDVESDGDFNLIKDKTYTTKTGGDGRHFYFKYEEDFKNAVRIFPSVDIRSEGGYVIGAHSESSKGAYEELNTLEVAQMSKETLKLLRGAKKKSHDGLPWYATSSETSYPQVAPDNLEYGGSAEGSRNDSMAKFAGTIHAKLHPSLWPTIGLQMFEQANFKNSPPLQAREMNTIWNSIENKEKESNPNGRNYSSGVSGNKSWGPDPEKDKKEDKPEVDSETGEVLEDPAAEEEDPKETLHVSEVAELQTVDSEHTYPLDMKPFDEALLGGASAGEVIVVAGQSGHGKTTLIQDWSVTLSSGGQEGERQKLPSLWFSYEVLAKPLWKTFQGMGAKEDVPIYMPRFNETGEVAWVTDVIEGAIEKWDVKVICIDHLGFLRPPRGNYSNAADAITNTVRALKQLAIKYGLIIFLPVHIRKTDAKTPDLNDIRDSLGIAQEADSVFFISREKDSMGLSTNQARISLIKNRKTGISVNATFDFQFGRYYYNAENDKMEVKKDETSDALKALKSFDEWEKKKQ